MRCRYWELLELHHQDSPLNAACLPDQKTGKTYDEKTKEKLKGEIIGFLVKTAREFATRQRRRADGKAVSTCISSGFAQRMFNGSWTRCKVGATESTGVGVLEVFGYLASPPSSCTSISRLTDHINTFAGFLVRPRADVSSGSMMHGYDACACFWGLHSLMLTSQTLAAVRV